MKYFILSLAVFFVTESHVFADKPTFTVKPSLTKHALGLKRDVLKHKAFKAQAQHENLLLQDATIPMATDLTAKVSPPENQGGCGSCWDFSITKALRSALMLVDNDPGTLAFNYLLNNCGGAANESGCGGGDFEAGLNMLNGKGPWLETQDPYTQRRGRCLSGVKVAGTALTWNVVGDGNSVPTFQELAAAVSQNHMLSVDVAVCGQWENYSSGIFNQNQCGARSINHMINMVGYSCETSKDSAGNCSFNAQGQPSNGDGYLLVMNNWGASWGENGYMRTRWGVDAIADTAMYFTVTAPPPPIPPVPPTPTPSGIPLWIWIVMGALGVIALVFGIGLIVKK